MRQFLGQYSGRHILHIIMFPMKIQRKSRKISFPVLVQFRVVDRLEIIDCKENCEERVRVKCFFFF